MAVPVVYSVYELRTSAFAGVTFDPVPSGITEGDLLVACIFMDGPSGRSVTPPSGWTTADGPDSLTSVTAQLFYKVATSADESATDYAFSFSHSETSFSVLMRITGIDSADIIHQLATDTGTSASPTCPSVTTTDNDCLILRIMLFGDGRITDDTGNPSGTTLVATKSTGTGTTHVGGGVAYQSQATAGSTGTAEWTNDTASDNWFCYTWAIAPTAAGGGGPSVNINGSTVNWNGLTSYNWNGIA